MKKLMIALGVLATACSLQAASFTWGFKSMDTVAKDGNYFGMGAYADASAFLYLGTVSLTSGKFDFGTATLLASVSAMNPDPDYNWGDFTAPGSSSSALVNADGGDDYTLILVDKGGLSTLTGFEGNAIIATGTSKGAAIPGAGETINYAQFVNDTAFGASDWQAVSSSSIPEPTSAMLLLLGFAGLALKRKNA